MELNCVHFKFLCIAVIFAMHGDCAKFLLIPVPLYSHCLEIAAVGQALVDRGHDVSIYMPDNFEHKDCFKKFSHGGKEMKPIIAKSKPGSTSLAKMSTRTSDLVLHEEFNILKHLDLVQEYADSACLEAIWDKEAIFRLKDEKFDLLIVDGFHFGFCTFLIPYMLKLPYVTISSVYDDFITAKPFMFSIEPYHMTRFPANMTFVERLGNMLFSLIIYELSSRSIPMNIVNEFIPEINKDDLIKLASGAELFLFNHDIILGFPGPRMPNHVYVGGITTLPSKPLPAEFDRLFKDTANGVVLVSLGSLFGTLPERVENNLHNALKRLEQKVLWKYTKADIDKNVIRVQWVPQNDILGHPKTKLFVSHCGNNGLYEALYHGVPILCIPLFADQFHNTERVKHWRVGSYVNLITSSEDELFQAITNVLESPEYSHNMKLASEMFHSQPIPPRERAATMVEHVLKFGGKHLRSQGTYMSTFSFMGYDIVAFVISCVFFIAFVSYKCLRMCIRRCLRKNQKLKTN